MIETFLYFRNALYRSKYDWRLFCMENACVIWISQAFLFLYVQKRPVRMIRLLCFQIGRLSDDVLTASFYCAHMLFHAKGIHECKHHVSKGKKIKVYHIQFGRIFYTYNISNVHIIESFSDF